MNADARSWRDSSTLLIFDGRSAAPRITPHVNKPVGATMSDGDHWCVGRRDSEGPDRRQLLQEEGQRFQCRQRKECHTDL